MSLVTRRQKFWGFGFFGLEFVRFARIALLPALCLYFSGKSMAFICFYKGLSMACSLIYKIFWALPAVRMK